jgi:hypothetical protein
VSDRLPVRAGEHPVIQPLAFVGSAREVLPLEDRDFTRWLSVHLEYLEELLGLSAFELIEIESPVGSFRLDIRAIAMDAEGQQVAVPIENQYGGSNHDHLGKLVTYTAQAATSAERVLGVWIVERARDEHLAAVNFLNEISPARVGWVLAEVRFAPGPDNTHYVQFEARSRPNAVLTSAPRQGGNPITELANREYVDAVLEAAAPNLRALGFHHPRGYGHSRRIGLPSDLPVSRLSEVRMMASQAYTRLTIVARSPSQDRNENEAILELLRERYESTLGSALPVGTELAWHARIASDVIDYAALTLRNGGYRDGDITAAAAWVASCGKTWIEALRRDPISDQELTAAAALAVEATGDLPQAAVPRD